MQTSMVRVSPFPKKQELSVWTGEKARAVGHCLVGEASWQQLEVKGGVGSVH